MAGGGASRFLPAWCPGYGLSLTPSLRFTGQGLDVGGVDGAAGGSLEPQGG